MPSEPSNDSPGDHQEETLSVQIANQIINVANARLQDGAPLEEVAQGIRHAAANFSAFVSQRHPDADPALLAEEFAQLLEFYLGRHKPENNPAGGLESLIEQVKSEF